VLPLHLSLPLPLPPCPPSIQSRLFHRRRQSTIAVNPCNQQKLKIKDAAMANSCRCSSGIQNTDPDKSSDAGGWPLKMLHNCRRNKRRLRCDCDCGCKRKLTLIPLHLIVSTRDFQLRPPWKSFIIYGFSYPRKTHLPTQTSISAEHYRKFVKVMASN